VSGEHRAAAPLDGTERDGERHPVGERHAGDQPRADDLTLPPLGNVDVGVNFNCTTQQNFTANIVLNATSPTTSGSVTVPVTSNIK